LAFRGELLSSGESIGGGDFYVGLDAGAFPRVTGRNAPHTTSLSMVEYITGLESSGAMDVRPVPVVLC
jgi:hypothetical protein